MEQHPHQNHSRLWKYMLSWKGIGFHLAGIAAILWFLLRTGTGPQRARYPCQQISFAIAIGYITFWSCMLAGLFVWVRSAKTRVAKTLPAILAAGLMVSTISSAVFATLPTDDTSIYTGSWTPIPKQPMGTPVGIYPGRVAWVWNPNATAQNLTGYWWEKQNDNQTVIDAMFSQGVCEITGTTNISSAWDALFHDFNQHHGNGDAGYQPGEKIALKINLNNAIMYLGGNAYTHEDNDRDASPYVVKALLRQLVNIVGVPQEDITVFDASREMPNCFYDRVYYKEYPVLHPEVEFPTVHFADMSGGAAGREKVVPSTDLVYIFNGTGLSRTLPTCVAEAKYLFDMPLLKRHPINMGVTLSGKNLYGSFIEPVSDIHPDHLNSFIMGNPAPATALLADRDLGGKMLLYIGDGTFATKVDHKTIAKFLMYPFNNDWTNSLFFSQDPIAMDSVMYDFLYNEGTDPCEGSQNYLHQAAVPPANVYDPENDGTFLTQSLGVHEHCDPNVSIFSPDRYSGPALGGIDYQPVVDGQAGPAVVITLPLEHHAYALGKEKAPFPFTFILGKFTVEAQVNGEVTSVEKIDFYIDGQLRYTDTQAPFTWLWSSPSIFRHTLKVAAYYTMDGGTYCSNSEIALWKLL